MFYSDLGCTNIFIKKIYQLKTCVSNTYCIDI